MDIALHVAVERMVAIALLLMGLSHALRPGLWGAFFTELFARPGAAAAVWVALFTLPWALLIVVAHNIWVADVPVIVTIIGWVMLVKCAIYLLFPGVPGRLARFDFSRRAMWVVGGVVMTALGAIVFWDAFIRWGA